MFTCFISKVTYILICISSCSAPVCFLTSQRSVDLLHVAQDLLSQQVDQPGDHLRIPPLDGVQSSFGQLGQLRVPDSMDRGGSVHVGQGLHLVGTQSVIVLQCVEPLTPPPTPPPPHKMSST